MEEEKGKKIEKKVEKKGLISERSQPAKPQPRCCEKRKGMGGDSLSPRSGYESLSHRRGFCLLQALFDGPLSFELQRPLRQGRRLRGHD